MNNFIDMNDVEQLIIDKLTGQIGDEDESRLEELIARHQEVEQLWQQMQQVYAMRKAVSFEQSFNADAAWLKLQDKVSIPHTPLPVEPDTIALPMHRTRPSWIRYGMAAAVAGVVLVSVYIIFSLYRNPAAAKSIRIQLANGEVVRSLPGEQPGEWIKKAQGATMDPTAWNTLSVPAGKTYTLQLTDGSQVWLNAVSELKFPLLFTQPQRNIQLQGEAYFRVAHNASQPFVVTVNGLTVKALGTSFNIKSYTSEKSCIALVTGSVMVQNSRGEQVVLHPGEAIVVDSDSILRKENFDEVAVLGWMKGLYIFHDEKLHNITRVAQRWFDVPFTLKEPSLADIPFTGAMERDEPLKNFLDRLATTGNIRYEIKNGEVLLSRN